MFDVKALFGHARAALVLGLPLAASQLAQFAVHMTDTIMIGWYGVDALAALVLASGYWFIIFIMLAGFGFAVMPIVASAAGAGDNTQVRRSTRMAAWHSIIFGIAVFPAFIFGPQILQLLGQEQALTDLARPYLILVGIEMLPALMVSVMRSYFSALERTRVVLAATLSAVVLNAALNWLLIFGHFGLPELGIAGAGLASVLVNVIVMIGLMWWATRATPEHDLFRNPLKPDWEAFRHIFRLGIPIGATALAEVGLFNAAALMMGWIGTVTLAAHGIALQIAALSFMIQIGLSQAATIRAGNAVGRRDQLGLRQGAFAVSALSLIMACTSLTVFLLIPEELIGLFIRPEDPDRPQVLLVGAQLLFFAALFQIADGGQVVSLALLRGLQDTSVPFWLAAVSYWLVGLPLAYVLAFPMGLGASGVWTGLAVALTAAWVMMAWRFWRIKGFVAPEAA